MSPTFILPPPPARTCEPRQRVCAARPDLPSDSPAFQAAVVLLAGPEQGFNIDRIAVRCALPRAAVAACVRRLIDNGVWVAGRAVCAWRGPDDPRFWNDAAVAEGRLVRRTGPRESIEWAPPGQWAKAYDFVGPQSDPGGAVLYLDCADAEGTPAADGAPAAPEHLRDGASVPATVCLPGLRLVPGAAAGVPDLFPGADWLC